MEEANVNKHLTPINEIRVVAQEHIPNSREILRYVRFGTYTNNV